MDAQPKRESACPKCGASATEESLIQHDLGALGYLHDDQRFECSECGYEYTHGVPIGEYDRDADDLWCDACDLGYMRVHRINPSDGGVGILLKCPHHYPFECPSCASSIPPDGVRPIKGGGRRCPFCRDRIARKDVPYCFYVTDVTREIDHHVAMVGVPTITGRTEEADRYGY